MAMTEPARHQLQQRLEEVLGPDEAATLMAHLLPFTWSELATKDDLARQTERLEGRLDHKIDNAVTRLDHKIDTAVNRLDHRIDTLEAGTNARFDQIDARFDHSDALMSSRIDQLGSQLRMEMADMRSEFHSTMRTNAYLILGGVSALVVAMSAITQFA